MKDKYFELIVSPSAFKDEILNFLMERFFNGIEESDSGFILRSEDKFDGLLEELKEYKSALEELFETNFDLKIELKEKSNRDWIKNYQESIKPVEIEEFYIRPSWYENKDNKVNIIIDPALAFGSGHHETTSSCVKAIKRYVKRGNELLDVGCGSGILGIIANKLGAEVTACDTDELAVKSTKENFNLNNATYKNIFQGSANNTNEKFDIVVANIIADILIIISSDLKNRLKPGAVLILSGIIDKYKDKVLKKYKDLELVEEIKENEWVTLVLKGVNE